MGEGFEIAYNGKFWVIATINFRARQRSTRSNAKKYVARLKQTV